MTPPFLVALLKEPGIPSAWVGEYLPPIIVDVAEEKAVGAMLQSRLCNLRNPPTVFVLCQQFMSSVNLLLAFYIQTNEVKNWHFFLLRRLAHGIGVVPAKFDKKGNNAGSNYLKSQSFLVEFSG